MTGLSVELGAAVCALLIESIDPIEYTLRSRELAMWQPGTGTSEIQFGGGVQDEIVQLLHELVQSAFDADIVEGILRVGQHLSRITGAVDPAGSLVGRAVQVAPTGNATGHPLAVFAADPINRLLMQPLTRLSGFVALTASTWIELRQAGIPSESVHYRTRQARPLDASIEVAIMERLGFKRSRMSQPDGALGILNIP